MEYHQYILVYHNSLPTQMEYSIVFTDKWDIDFLVIIAAFITTLEEFLISGRKDVITNAYGEEEKRCCQI